MAYNSGYWEELEGSLRKQLAEARAENAALVAEFQRLSDEPPTLEEIAADLDKIEMLGKELAEARAEVERLKAPALNASLLREKLAELAHDQWAGWMEYLFFKSKQVDGCVVIPAWANERWRRQVATRYADLSEEEKDSDRSEADKFLAVFNAQLAERDKLIEQMRDALIVADSLVTSLIDTHVDRCASVYDFDRNIIKAALSAAERINR